MTTRFRIPPRNARRAQQSAAAAMVTAAIAASSAAQSFNVDLDFNSASLGGGVPASGFAARGTPGVWNLFSQTATSAALVDLTGTLTSRTLTRSTASSMSGNNSAATTGDYEKLLDDYQILPATGSLTFTFANLSPGRYKVATYAVRGGNSAGRASVNVTGALGANPLVCGGVLPSNAFTAGVTHVVHDVDVASSGGLTISVSTSGPAAGAVNGIQLVYTQPTRLYVNAASPAGGDGLSWSSAFNDLQIALASAAALPTVTELWVAAGTYKPGPPGGSRALTFSVPAGRSVYAGFSGTETLLSQRNLTANITRLSGDLAGDDQPGFLNRSDNAMTVVTLGGGVRLDGFTVSGGQNDTGGGGGVRMVGQGGRLDRCRITDNYASSGGGVYANGSGEALIVRTVIQSNRAESAAGFYSGSNGTVVSCTIAGNVASGDGGAGVVNGNCRLDQCVLTGNVGYPSAGMLVVGNLALNNCTCVGNVNWVVGLQISSTLTATNSIFNRNPLSVSYNGGFGLVTKTNCLEDAPVQFADAAGLDGLLGTDDDDLSLLASSIGIDWPFAGLPLDVADLDEDGNRSETVPLDLRGNPRQSDVGGTGGTGLVADAGAIESTGSVSSWALAAGSTGVWGSAGSWSNGIPALAVASLGGPAGATRTVRLTSNAAAARLVASGSYKIFAPGDAPRTLTIQGIPTTATPSVILGASPSPSSIEFGLGALSTPSDIRVGDAALGYSASVQFSNFIPTVTCRNFLVAAGSVTLNNSYIDPSGTFRILPFGSLAGSGNILSNVELQGTMRPGRLNITGDFRMQLSSDYAVEPSLELTGASSPALSDVLQVTDGMFLRGTLRFDLAAPDLLVLGTQWTFLTAPTRTGTFTSAFLPGDATKAVRLVYQDSARSSAVIAQVENRASVQSLNPPVGFSIPGAPSAAAVGKIRNDLLPLRDLAVVVPSAGNPTGSNGVLKVLTNLGTTATAWNGYAAVVTDFPTERNPSGVCIADFNNDGFNDVAVSNRNGSGGVNGSVSVFRNNGAGSLVVPATVVTTGIGREPSAIGAGDVTGDGKVDLVVTNALDNTVSVLQNTSNNGGVSFSFVLATPTAVPVGSNPVAVSVRDLDGDSSPDIAVANRDSDDVSILSNAGAALGREGGERAWAGLRPARFYLAGDEPSSIQPGNIDNGKETQVVVTNSAAGTVSVLARGPGGDYTASSGSIGTTPTSVALLDVDNDPAGLLDIVAVTNTGGTPQISVLQTELGPNGEIVLTGSPPITPPDPPTLCLADDLNGDGTDDLISINPDTVALRTHTDDPGETRGAPSTIKALLNFRPCPADLTLDRLVNTADLTFFLGRFGQPATPGSLAARADFNHDGAVNTSDLTFFLGRFGMTCP